MPRPKSNREFINLRTYKELAQFIIRSAGERGLSVAEFMDRFVGPCVEKAHADWIAAEFERIKRQAGSEGD